MTAPPELRLLPAHEASPEALFSAVRESIVEVGRWQSWCHAGYSLADARTWIEGQSAARAAGTAFEFVLLGPEEQLLGTCGVNQIDRATRRGNLGYWIRTRFAGRGLATVATRRLTDWIFAETDLLRLEIVAAVGNLASQRVAEKAGALREGLLRRRLVIHGIPHDAVLYSLIR